MVTALKLFAVACPAPSDADVQLCRHLSEGVNCLVLNEDAWTDSMGLLSIINEDNLNAGLDMATNEMEVLTFISQEQATQKKLDAEAVFDTVVSRFGSKCFTTADLRCLWNFCLMVPAALVKNLAELHFSLIPASALRCPPKHFHAIAGLAVACPYAKVALVVSLYLAAPQAQDGKRAVQGVAALCGGIRKELLDSWKKNEDTLKTMVPSRTLAPFSALCFLFLTPAALLPPRPTPRLHRRHRAPRRVFTAVASATAPTCACRAYAAALACACRSAAAARLRCRARAAADGECGGGGDVVRSSYGPTQPRNPS